MPVPVCWLVCCAIAILAIAPAAQAPLPSEATWVHAWSEAPRPLGFHLLRARCCRLGHDDRNDVVLLSPLDSIPGPTGIGRCNLIYMPDAGAAHACVPLGVVMDYAVLSGAADDGCDALLSVEVDGTMVCHAWAAGQPLPVPRVVGSWPGTVRLWAVRNGSTIEVFGLDVTGVRLRRATWTEQGLGTATITTTAPGLTNIQAMDWDGDGVLELVFATGGVAAVRRWNQAPVVNLPIGNSAPMGTRPMIQVSNAQSGSLLVGYVSDGVTTALTWANATTSGMLNLGTLSASAMAAYDRDGDGDEDIVLADAAHSVLHVFLRRGNGFVPATAPLLVGSAAPDCGLSAVVGADLDGDGDGDLMAWNDGSGATHTFLDGLVGDLRPSAASGDLANAVLGQTAAVPVAIALPPGLPRLTSPGTTLCLRLCGWLVDAATDQLIPQRVLELEQPIAGTQAASATTLAFATGGMAANWLLQLQIAVVAVHADGSRHSYPPLLLHLTPSAVRATAMRAQVDLECTGSPGSNKADGGGDGNILGTKITKIAVGSPPI